MDGSTPIAHRTRACLKKRKIDRNSLLGKKNTSSNKNNNNTGKEVGGASSSSATGASATTKLALESTGKVENPQQEKENIPSGVNIKLIPGGMDKEDDGKVMDKHDDVAAVADDDSQPREAAVVVMKSNELERFEDPSSETAKLTAFMSSEDWLEVYEATTMIRRLIIHHSSSEFICSKIPEIIDFLTTGVESLRSTQVRNSLLAVGDLFHHFTDKQVLVSHSNEIDRIIDAVLMKSVNDKRFIASAGVATIDQMATSTPSVEILCSLMRHSESKNAKICTVVARGSLKCLKGIVTKPEAKAKLIEDDQTLTSLLISYAQLELGKSVDAKKPSQEGLRIVRKCIGSKERFESVLQKDAYSTSDIMHIMKIVEQQPKRRDNPNVKKTSLKQMLAEKRREMSKNNSDDSSSGSGGNNNGNTDVLL